jgi:hypothetical protein
MELWKKSWRRIMEKREEFKKKNNSRIKEGNFAMKMEKMGINK